MSLSTAFAEKQEWLDKNYDFSKVKTVLICDPTISDHIKNGIKEREIKEIFDSKIKLSEKIKVIYVADLVPLITAETGTNPLELYVTDQQKAVNLITEAMFRYSDVIITTNVLEYDTGKEYREGYSYNTTEYQTSYINGPYGTTTVQTPVTKTHNVSGGNVQVAYAAVRFEVTDSKTKKPVISRIDDRARANPTVFDNTKPKDLYGRILNSFLILLKTNLNKNY